MERKSYRNCAVPQCRNTTISTPNKIFIDVPRNADGRKKWFDLARKKFEGMSVTSAMYFCEDHFDLPNDMENYVRYRVMGIVSKIRMNPGCLPSKFHCQSDRKRSLPSSTVTSQSTAIKRQRLSLIDEAFEVSTLKCDTEEVNKTWSPSLPVEVNRKNQPKTQNKGVQVFVKTKYFRSKSTQTKFECHCIASKLH